VDNTEDKRERVLSLCSGYGGLELGLRRIFGERIRTVAYVEVEAFAVANLVAEMEAGKLDAAPVWTDIKTFDGAGFRGKVHGITAGYPCQPFSVAGKRQGTDDPRHLWPHISRIVQAVRPVWCFFENVAGHLTLGFPEVYRELRNMGYSVEAGLFTAAECGISMAEGTRLFILAKAHCFKDDILLQGRRPQKAKSYIRRPGEILGKANINRLQGHRPAKQRGRNEFTPTGVAVAPQGVYQESWEEKRFIKSRLGRAAYGTSSRVDRLRLLGNGVVPQQAELAFRTLADLYPPKAGKTKDRRPQTKDIRI